MNENVRTREISSRNLKIRTRRVNAELFALVYACFPDVHTGETSKIRIGTSTRKRKLFLFLVLLLVFISCMLTLGSSCARAFPCAYEPGLMLQL